MRCFKTVFALTALSVALAATPGFAQDTDEPNIFGQVVDTRTDPPLKVTGPDYAAAAATATVAYVARTAHLPANACTALSPCAVAAPARS